MHGNLLRLGIKRFLIVCVFSPKMCAIKCVSIDFRATRSAVITAELCEMCSSHYVMCICAGKIMSFHHKKSLMLCDPVFQDIDSCSICIRL